MKPWFPGGPLQNFDFSEGHLWIRVEGLPITTNEADVVCRALVGIEKLLYFDADSRGVGAKKFVREKVLVSLEKTLIPRFY